MISPISLVAPLVYLFSKSKKVKLQLEIYTGACTHYKVKYINSQPSRSVVIKAGTGVVVINRTWKTLRFFFDDEPIVFDRDFTVSTDNLPNEETFDNGGNEEATCNYDTKTFELLEGKYLHTVRDQYSITELKLELHTLKVKE